MREEWSSEQVMNLRKICRRGGSFAEARNYMCSTLTDKQFTKRMADLNIRFSRCNRIHEGTSVLTQGEVDA